MDQQIAELKRRLDQSRYTTVICGSGMMREGGYIGIKKMERVYEIEKKYGTSPEYLFSSSYYNTRPDQFFQFYKQEILQHPPELTESTFALAAMERAGKLQCTITSNLFEVEKRSGCNHVINLYGSVYQNRCPRCGQEYPIEYMMEGTPVPICEHCKVPVRPQISLFGEMVDSQLMTRTVKEIEQAEVLLLLGTNLNSEVFASYIKYFNGSSLVVIHEERHYLDDRGDMVILDQPKNVLPKLGY